MTTCPNCCPILPSVRKTTAVLLSRRTLDVLDKRPELADMEQVGVQLARGVVECA